MERNHGKYCALCLVWSGLLATVRLAEWEETEERNTLLVFIIDSTIL